MSATGSGAADARAPDVKALPPSRERRLWFGVLAAPVAWSLHEVVGYTTVGQGCVLGRETLTAGSWMLFIGVSLACMGLAAAGGWAAWASFRRSTGHPVPVWRTEGWGRAELMGAFGTLLSAILLLNMLMFSVAPLFLDPCATVR